MVYANNDPVDYNVEPSTPFVTRRRHLQFIYHRILKSDNVRLIPQARTEDEKRSLVQVAKDNALEGVMLKRKDSLYNCAGFCSGILKAKFVKTADCVVIERNTKGHQNASLGVYDTNGNMVYVGNVSMLGKGDAAVGDVLEVKYLYATDDNILYQPRVMKRRDDKVATDCLLNQLVKTSKEVVRIQRTNYTRPVTQPT
jgi:hypothetical protein